MKTNIYQNLYEVQKQGMANILLLYYKSIIKTLYPVYFSITIKSVISIKHILLQLNNSEILQYLINYTILLHISNSNLRKPP